MESKDIFELPLPNEVYIVGCAPNVRDGLHRIPSDAFVIVLSAAVTLPCPKSLWMCFDEGIKTRDWWGENFKPPCLMAFGEKRIKELKPNYTFKYLPTLASFKDFKFIPGVLHGGATIAGCALQLCMQKGVKRVCLCGVSMAEPVDFDGHVPNEKTQQRKNYLKQMFSENPKYKKNWGQKVRFEFLTSQAQRGGMKIVSLTKTEIRNIEEI